MLAGQHIPAGQVCVEVDQTQENLLVSYEMEDGWQLVEAHLWAGLNIANMPQTKNGSPKIGNFPYVASGLSGAEGHTFTVPLTVFGAAQPCDVTALLAAHAALRKDLGGGVYQTETGWLEGDLIALKGSWAMKSSVFFTCPVDAVLPPPAECKDETAYAVGDRTFIDIGITNSRWGWELAVSDGEEVNADIYAGAAQNDTGKGTKVGVLHVSRAGETVSVSYEMDSGYTMGETHLYVGKTEIATTSLGQYGNQHDLTEAGTDSYTVTVSGADPAKPLYVVAHAVVAVCK